MKEEAKTAPSPLRWQIPVATALFGIVFGAIFLIQKEAPEDEIPKAVFHYLRDAYEKKGWQHGREFTVGTIKILSQEDLHAITLTPVDCTEDPPRDYLLSVSRHPTGWVVAHDLRETFELFCKIGENEQALLTRLAEKLRKRFGDQLEITIKKGLRSMYRVDILKDSVIGYWEVRFGYPDGFTPRSGRYIETYTVEVDGWKVQGQGRLLDSVR